MSALAFARLPKPQSEAYVGSVIGRRETSQKDPDRAYVNKKRAAQDEYQALGDAGRKSLKTARNSGIVNY